ncbi:MAG: hypothetical protein IT232_10310 [Flavobacteriales bacterium]|nr:hypothetical protein [Flavobacteriales bacterium]
MKKIVLIITLELFVFTAFSGDILILKNDMIFDGKVTKIKDCEIIFKAEGCKYTIPTSEIFSIQFKDTHDKVYKEYIETAVTDSEKCLKGKFDAEYYHGKEGDHFLMGMLFGPFAVIGTALAEPTPDRGKQTYMLSKNKDQFNNPEYLNCYKKKAKGQLIKMEALGWGAWILFVIAVTKL